MKNRINMIMVIILICIFLFSACKSPNTDGNTSQISGSGISQSQEISSSEQISSNSGGSMPDSSENSILSVGNSSGASYGNSIGNSQPRPVSGNSSSSISKVTEIFGTKYQSSISFDSGLGIQGKNQWYYQQWDGTRYSNLSWDNANKRWIGKTASIRIGKTEMSPEKGKDAIRKWIVPCDGIVSLKGNIKCAIISGTKGVSVEILHNSTSLWKQNISTSASSAGINYLLNRNVKAGDAIYFKVTSTATGDTDTLIWDPLVIFAPLSKGANSQAWDFKSSTDEWEATTNCTITASGGFLNGKITGDTPKISSAYGLNIDITKNAIIKLRLKNNSSDNVAAIYFTTMDDELGGEVKKLEFTVNRNDSNYTIYTVDMSGMYGWIGKLNQLIVCPTHAASGTFSIDYIYLQAGGTETPGFSLLDKEVIYNNNTLKNVMNLDYYTDSGFGIRRNSDASYDFFTANGGGQDGQNSIITHGTLEDPAKSITHMWDKIEGVPADIDYIATETVYQDPGDPKTILAFLHLEKQFMYNNAMTMDAFLGLAITRDNGNTWKFCGTIIGHDIETKEFRPGYDIGGGAYIIYNSGGVDYFYVYASDVSDNSPNSIGLSVSRAPVKSVMDAAKNNTTVPWFKYCDGEWKQPSMDGSFTNIFNPNKNMNWMSVSYNSYIKKYLLSYTSTDQWKGSNYSDITLLVADSPTDFNNNTKEYLIDASDKYCQYPTIIGLGNKNPQIESQKNFYIYYMQWSDLTIWGSDTNLCRKMIILD
ncbi:MAG: hypothetical protein ACYCYI_11685 [Saccharofermentanales bacterium]